VRRGGSKARAGFGERVAMGWGFSSSFVPEKAVHCTKEKLSENVRVKEQGRKRTERKLLNDQRESFNPSRNLRRRQQHTRLALDIKHDRLHARVLLSVDEEKTGAAETDEGKTSETCSSERVSESR
jgi:hypothetical protein